MGLAYTLQDEKERLIAASEQLADLLDIMRTRTSAARRAGLGDLKLRLMECKINDGLISYAVLPYDVSLHVNIILKDAQGVDCVA